MKSKLLSIPRTNLLYLPVLVQNTVWDNSKPSGSSDIHLVWVDNSTVGLAGSAGFINNAQPDASQAIIGMMNGFQPAASEGYIGVDQGLNTSEIPPTTIFFKIQASTELQTSTYLFEQLGAQTSILNVAGDSQDVRYIDSNIKVTGATTGYSINLPIRFIKNIPA